MSEIGLVHYISTVGGITFTVNLAAANVAVSMVGNPILCAENSGANRFFVRGDNVNIEAVAVVFPYQFGFGTLVANLPTVQFVAVDPTGAILESLPMLGWGGHCVIPEINQEVPLSAFINQPSMIADKWALRVQNLFQFNVNMFNVPGALDTTVQAVKVMLKVRHTFQMIA